MPEFLEGSDAALLAGDGSDVARTVRFLSVCHWFDRSIVDDLASLGSDPSALLGGTDGSLPEALARTPLLEDLGAGRWRVRERLARVYAASVYAESEEYTDHWLATCVNLCSRSADRGTAHVDEVTELAYLLVLGDEGLGLEVTAAVALSAIGSGNWSLLELARNRLQEHVDGGRGSSRTEHMVAALDSILEPVGGSIRATLLDVDGAARPSDATSRRRVGNALASLFDTVGPPNSPTEESLPASWLAKLRQGPGESNPMAPAGPRATAGVGDSRLLVQRVNGYARSTRLRGIVDRGYTAAGVGSIVAEAEDTAGGVLLELVQRGATDTPESWRLAQRILLRETARTLARDLWRYGFDSDNEPAVLKAS